MRTRSSTVVVTILVAAVAVGVSCVAPNNAALKQAFAPDFGTATEAQLQDGMWRLGYATQDLAAALSAEGVPDDERHTAIMENLNLMADAAASVGPDKPQKHKNVAMNIGKLVGDIDAARTAAASRDYTLAQALPQSCLACHVGAGGGAQKK